MPAANADWNRRRSAARKYQPHRIRLLLVPDSPPAEFGRSFYSEESRAGEGLFEETCSVLFEQRPEGNPTPYLRELRRRGVFVVELKPDGPRSDRESLASYVAPFLLNLDALAPDKIAVLDPDAYDALARPMRVAGLPLVEVRIPSWSAEHGAPFRRELRRAVVRADLERLIRPLPKPRPARG